MIQQRRRHPSPVQLPVAEVARSKSWVRANAGEEAGVSCNRRAEETRGGGAVHSVASADVAVSVDARDNRFHEMKTSWKAQRVLMQRDRLLLEVELARQARTLHHDEESRGHLEEARTILAELREQREL